MALVRDVKAKLEAGRRERAAELRTLAEQLDRLSIADAAEAMTWLEPHLDRLRREADLILHR